MILKVGNKGEDVKKVQSELIALGYDLGAYGADGHFGQITENAVRQWQQDMFVDGSLEDDELRLLFSNQPRKGVDIPAGQSELVRLYGRPWEDEQSWQRRWMGWANIGLAYDHVVRARNIGGKQSCFIYCNVDCIEDLEWVFGQIVEHNLAHEIKSYDGCYNLRLIRGFVAARDDRSDSMPWSTHSWGVAIDLNAKTNQLGMEPQINRTIVRLFKERGWVWGGDFTRKDGMHFQRCK